MTYLLMALGFVAVMQPAGTRRAAACLFVGLTLGFDAFGSDIDGPGYYLAAAATDSLCIVLLGRICIEEDLVDKLQRLCLLSIVLNVGGWLAYEAYLPPSFYDKGFQFFYAYVILLLLIGGLTHADNTDSRGLAWIPSHNN